jgi:hypothetical protein
VERGCNYPHPPERDQNKLDEELWKDGAVRAELSVELVCIWKLTKGRSNRLRLPLLTSEKKGSNKRNFSNNDANQFFEGIGM